MRRYLISLLLLVAATSAVAQQAATPSAPEESAVARWLQAWQSKGLSVRQTFDGSKNESKPAAFSYLNPLYTADIGVKLVEWDPLKNSITHTLPIGPSIEWHRTNTPKPSNTVDAKLNIEFAQGQLSGFLPDGSPAPNPSDVPQHTVGYSISLKPGLTRDVLTHTTGVEHIVSFTIVSLKNYYPNAITVDTEGRHLWRYSPSVGAEYYGKKDLFDRTDTEQKTTDISFARARLFVVAYPFNANMEDRNEASVDFTYRWRTGGQPILSNNHYLSVLLTHYLDKKHTIGVGVEYDHGRDPAQKFQNLKQGKLTLRLGL
jgi:hypothetical protein